MVSERCWNNILISPGVGMSNTSGCSGSGNRIRASALPIFFQVDVGCYIDVPLTSMPISVFLR